MIEEGLIEARRSWFRGRPKAIQDLARKYPPGWYGVRDSNLFLFGYSEDGEHGAGLLFWPDEDYPETPNDPKTIRICPCCVNNVQLKSMAFSWPE